MLFLVSLFVAGSTTPAAAEENATWTDVSNSTTDASLSLLRMSINMIRNAPQPDFIGNEWFLEQYGTMFQLSVLLVVPFAIVAVIAAIIKGGTSSLLKVFLLGVPVSVFGAFAALAVVAIMLKIEVEITNVLLDKLDADFANYYNALATSTGPPEDNAGLLLLHWFIMLLMAIGTVVLFLELIFRAVALYVAVVFLPLSLAAYAWAPARAWFSTLANITVVLIAFKIVVVGVLVVAFASIRFAFADGAVDEGQDSAVAMHVGAALSGMLAFMFAAFGAPTLVAVVLGSDARPAMTRYDFGKSTPMSADQQFVRGEYGKLVVPYQNWKRHRAETGRGV